MVALLSVHLAVLSPGHPPVPYCWHLALARPVREITGWRSCQRAAAGVQTGAPSSHGTALFIRPRGLRGRRRGALYSFQGPGTSTAESPGTWRGGRLDFSGSRCPERSREHKAELLPLARPLNSEDGWGLQVNSGTFGILTCSFFFFLPEGPFRGSQDSPARIGTGLQDRDFSLREGVVALPRRA